VWSGPRHELIMVFFMILIPFKRSIGNPSHSRKYLGRGGILLMVYGKIKVLADLLSCLF